MKNYCRSIPEEAQQKKDSSVRWFLTIFFFCTTYLNKEFEKFLFWSKLAETSEGCIQFAFLRASTHYSGEVLKFKGTVAPD